MRSEVLAACFHVVDILVPGPPEPLDSLCVFFMPDPRLLNPVSLFLTDERSDAAVVGSGNKAMRKSPSLTFWGWDNLKLAGLGAP